MTELELMANEEARHGNREALERLEAELAQHRDATNQCRLAFAGYVSVQSAVNKLDALAKIQENDE